MKSPFVRHEIRPLALALESGGNGVMPQRFFPVAQFRKSWVAHHEVTCDQRHLDHGFPVGIKLLARAAAFGCVGIRAFRTVLLRPCERLLILVRIKNTQVETTRELAHVHILVPHAQIILVERLVHVAARNAHGDSPHGEVALSSHCCHGKTCSREAQEFLLNVRGDRIVAGILDVASVDAKCGETFLIVSGKDRCKIDGSGSFRAVEAPDRLWYVRCHVHGLRAIAPARGHGDGEPHSFSLELCLASGRFGHTANGRVRDDALNRQSVRMPKVRLQKPGARFGHSHCLVFQALPDTPETPVYGRSDPDLW
jgi:hypothetical protein